jgi:hypothetical protein
MTFALPKEMTHVQAVAAAEWNIVHGFGRVPAVDVYIQLTGWSTPRKALPEEVKIVSANEVKITFAGIPTAGTAILR